MARAPFIPPKLPPKLDYNAFIKEISSANRALGELNGLLVNIPNPDLLTSPLLTKEAVLSSRIEGTQASLEDVLKYEAEDKSSEVDEKEKDIREIINYRQAMRLAIEELEKRPISENLIKKLHYVLLDSVRGARKDRGNIRTTQVFISSPGASIEEATYIAPPATEISSLLSGWETYINSDKEQDPIVQIGLAHYQFEAIHPFLDGNGRIGRLLIPLFLYQRGLLSYPLLYISEYFEENRKTYYELLNNVSSNEDWNSWLKFFLNAITTESLKTKVTVMSILDLYNSLKTEITSINSIYAQSLLDIIFITPIVSFASIKGHLKAASNQTIYNLLAKFEKAGILQEISGKQRDRVYVFNSLIEILK
ncbi:MAG TPA: Fic family protein [Candidatus Aquicultor sp.]